MSSYYLSYSTSKIPETNSPKKEIIKLSNQQPVGIQTNRMAVDPVTMTAKQLVDAIDS